MYILRHHRVGSLGREVLAQLVFHGQARVDAHKRLAADAEERQVQTGVQAPAVAERQLVFAVDSQLMGCVVVMAAAREAVGLLLHTPQIHLRTCLRSELVEGVVVAEADVVVRRWSVVELRTVAQVADGGAVVVFNVGMVVYVVFFVEGLLVVGGEQRGAVVGIDGGEVRQQLRRELVAPVQRGVQVAPAESVLVDVAIAQAAVVFTIPGFTPVVLRAERVLSVVDAQIHLRPSVEDVRQLRVQVVEVVGQRNLLLVVVVVGNGEGWPSQQVEP